MKITQWMSNTFRKPEPPFDFDKAVTDLIATLPRLTGKVVIVCPAYDKNFKCNVVVDSKLLLPWAENHAKNVSSSHQESQTARLALPLLLAQADYEDSTVTYLPIIFHEAIGAWATGFVKDGTASVFCHSCKKHVVPNIISPPNKDENMKSTRSGSGWIFWTDHWTCECGATLYYEEQEAHIFCGSK